jgi:hypothetical protein
MRFALFTVAAAVIASASVPRNDHVTVRAGPTDTIADARSRMAQVMLDSLGTRGSLPAESIWTDLKTNLKRVPARNLIAIMNLGYGRSLGVTCNFCHVPGHYDREDSTWKQVAREMVAMDAKINQELLAPIPNLKGPNPIINCTTCHRGQVKPALNLDSLPVH